MEGKYSRMNIINQSLLPSEFGYETFCCDRIEL